MILGMSKSSKRWYGTIDLIKDLLILVDIHKFSFQYRSWCGFKNLFRINIGDFEILLNLITPKIKKDDTSFRRAVSADERILYKK